MLPHRRRTLLWTLFACLALCPAARAQTDATGQRARVEALLQVPHRGTMTEIAAVKGLALRALDFDGLPIAHEFLADDQLGSDAAYAMLGADETRGLTMLFASVPQSGPNIQRIAFTWFLDRYETFSKALTAEARQAALRTLDPVRSTANAEAALYVLGLAGSQADTPVLEFHLVNVRTGSRGMRDASHAALLRLGSATHLDRIQTELSRPLATDATYQQGVSLTLALQKAAFSARTELIPAVCGHVQDAPLREVDIRVDTGRAARLALNAIVDHVSVTHLSAGPRSPEDWVTYCTALQPAPSR